MCGIAWLVPTHAWDPAEEQQLRELLRRRGPDVQRAVDAGYMGVFYAAVLHMRGVLPCIQPAEDEVGNLLCFNGEIYSFANISEAPIVLRGLSRSSRSGEGVARYLSTLVGPWSLIYAHRKTGHVFFARDPIGRRSLLLGRTSAGDIAAVASVSAGQNLTWTECPPNGVYCYDSRQRTLSHFPWPKRDALQGLDGFSGSTTFSIPVPLTVRECSAPLAPHTMSACVDALEEALQRAVRVRITNLAVWIPPSTTDGAAVASAAEITTIAKGSSIAAVAPSASATASASAAASMVLKQARIGKAPSLQHSPVAILFSGGVDCTILAAMAHRCLDPTYPIDLVNVCFDAPTHESPDRLGAVYSLRCLKRQFPDRHWRLILIDRDLANQLHDDGSKLSIARLLHPKVEAMDYSIGSTLRSAATACGRLLLSSAEERELYGKAVKALRARKNEKGTEANILSFKDARALFRTLHPFLGKRVVASSREAAGANRRCEGGLQCTHCSNELCGKVSKRRCVLRACKRCCFKARECLSQIGGEDGLRGSGGDGFSLVTILQRLKLSGLSSLVECPAHKAGRLKQHAESISNIEAHKALPLGDASAQIEQHKVAQYTFKTASEDDAEIVCTSLRKRDQMGSGVWKNHSLCDSQGRRDGDSIFESSARVLLSGLGADEQLGGYGRHRTARAKGGLKALHDELQKDVSRLWERNLGRDGRCLSDSGREARYPFLDEEVMRVISTFPLNALLDYEKPRGVGDKLVLRMLAQRLGLGGEGGVAFVPKRAIQFGTRIAQKINTCVFGSNSKGSGDVILDFAKLGNHVKRTVDMEDPNYKSELNR